MIAYARTLVTRWRFFEWHVSPGSGKGICYSNALWPVPAVNKPDLPIIYAHFLIEKQLNLQTAQHVRTWRAGLVLEPAQLLYIGERAGLSNFESGPQTPYPWCDKLVKSQLAPYPILSLYWELKDPDFTDRDLRVTLEYLIHQELFVRYFHTADALRYNLGMQFHKSKATSKKLKICQFEVLKQLAEIGI